MMQFSWACAVAAGVAARVTGQSYTVFRPQGYSDLQPLDFGRGPDPLHIAQHLTQVKTESDLCEGVNDVLAVTLPAPIVGDISPEHFTLIYCPVANDYDDYQPHYWPPHRDDCVKFSPACAQLQLEDEPNERRTLLLFGKYVEFEGRLAILSLVQTEFSSITFVVDGKQPSTYGQYTSGQGFGIGWWQHPEDPVLGYGQGPFLADISRLNLSAPLNTAATDPNGCAARHPSATYAVRLLFASAVHERATEGSLAPFGTNATAAAALFTLRTGRNGEGMSPDRVVGVAGVPGGSAVDVCIESTWGTALEQVEAVVINCTAAAPLSPAGFPCANPIKAFVRSEEDQRAGRDPATFTAGHTIEFCLLDPEDCPGAAPAPPDYSDYDYDGGGDDYSDGGGGDHGPDGRADGDLERFIFGAGAAVAVAAVLAGLGVAGYL